LLTRTARNAATRNASHPVSPAVGEEKDAAFPYFAILCETGRDCQRENRDDTKKTAKK
jgi:hypothetical protein